ncbi:Plasmodium exported protein, unknown function [Plasmodium knowlesi strain H]|uniref:Uncharacterized protein n=3 Tax=Plasmodium knowlesi TaxID=5850 RepID=A0A1A7W6P5_PLAKH|nr:Plasmodium exported protein, unknown function [Plasmodium knowlesi strain H]OTN68599.1 Uncharacterized protein PKNOH_S02292600 [Plasmodium knowlesi]CAA9986432.1 Plasmodium exported protein, unknown function [Plasmodium knowlesi strain H]SBO24323.1 Plasmodium exported protein, unknown function [Plasmodium knowlesi strain H]SBO29680.1 Plasmodium exported protein, unknown function [Plasmodium knowlesi strain H]VVS75906.1 Plasmodium exported protein, unknown function [Plasmodium knowlesi strain
MAVPTKQNKKARKVSSAFPFCSKISLYTLLIWIVNCSNSCQYDGNSYSVMNNSLGKAFDSRALRLLAEAVVYEDEVEQDGPVVYEDEIEQDGPVIYEEDIEQDGPVVYEEDIEQDGPVVYEEDIEQDGPVVYEEDIEQDGPVVYEEDIEQDGPVVYEDEIEQDGAVESEDEIEQDGAVESEDEIEQDGPVVYEDEVEQDGPVVYEDEIEQDGPVIYEEDIEQDGPVVYEDEIEQDGPVVYEEEIEQDGPVVYEEDIEQDGPVVYEEVAQQVPKQLGKKGKKEYKDGRSTFVGARDINKEKSEMDSYRQRKLDFWEHFEPTITANFEEVLKRCISRKAGEQDVDEYYSAGLPKLGWNADPYGVLKKTKKGTVQEGYRKMLENNFRNVPYIDDTQNDHKSNEPYLEREYGRVELDADAKTSTNLRKGAEKKMNKKM